MIYALLIAGSALAVLGAFIWMVRSSAKWWQAWFALSIAAAPGVIAWKIRGGSSVGEGVILGLFLPLFLIGLCLLASWVESRLHRLLGGKPRR